MAKTTGKSPDAAKPPAQPEPPLTVEHLTNSLGQIELWVKAVRAALGSLDPKMKLNIDPVTSQKWAIKAHSPLLIDKECPPPEIK